MIDSGDVDFANIDCVLLFNVVHQMIFARGLPYVQTALKKIVQSVDAVFVELATRDQYVPHKKDHLLPVEAAEVLSKCSDCDIHLLRGSPRPLYLLRRRSLQLSAERFSFDSVRFSDHEDPYISRKYYVNGSEFLKLFRFTSRQQPGMFHAEVKGLLALQGKSVCPDIIDWGKDVYTGYVRTERVYGQRLVDQVGRFDTKLKRNRIVAELLRLARALVRAGLHQNDFSAHNMIITSDGSLRLFDFEHAQSRPLYDSFAFLLWIISDVHAGKLNSYERQIFSKLVLAGAPRVSHEFYPDREQLVQAGLNPRFIDDAFSSTDWAQFVEVWHSKFSSLAEETTVNTV